MKIYGVITNIDVKDKWKLVTIESKDKKSGGEVVKVLSNKEGMFGDYEPVVENLIALIVSNDPPEGKSYHFFQSFVKDYSKPKVVAGTVNRKEAEITLGNLINVVDELDIDISAVVSVAASLFDDAMSIKNELREKYPDMDDYSLGARYGQCMLQVSKRYKKEDWGSGIPDVVREKILDLFEEIKTTADSILERLSTPHKEEKKVVKKKATRKKAATKKSTNDKKTESQTKVGEREDSEEGKLIL